MKSPLRLLVVSDLHVGKLARSVDLSPVRRKNIIEDGYRNRLTTFLTKESITADYLVCPGDASNEAQPDEFIMASEFVLEIAAASQIPSDRVIYVPGNHDTNWNVQRAFTADAGGLGRSLRYAPLSAVAHIWQNVVNRSPMKLWDEPPLGVWEDSDTVFVGFNSSWHDRPEDEPHHGSIESETLNRLRDVLKTLPLDEHRLRVFVVHHHPFLYEDPSVPAKDFSALQNAKSLLALLLDHRFDLIIHGHMHRPFFTVHGEGDKPFVVVLGAGSLSAILRSEWHGSVANQFHRITVDARDTSTLRIQGKVESWAYTSARGWEPSQQATHGIEAAIAFGTYTLPHELERRLEAAILAERGSTEFAQLAGALERDPGLKYVSVRSIMAAVDTLLVKLKCQKFGDPPNLVLVFTKAL